MKKAPIAALLGASLFAFSQGVAAQSTAVTDEEARCFVSGCDDAQASDEAASADDECMASGVCPVGETRGFHLQTGSSATKKSTPTASSSSRPAASRPNTTRYTGSRPASGSSVGQMTMPSSRQSLDMRLEFELGSAQLTSSAQAQADVFARALKDAPGTRQFVIEGHTDSIGSAGYNMRLSRERAKAVVDYLVGHGVPKEKLRSIGYGFQHPREGTKSSDPTNRRVEIVKY